MSKIKTILIGLFGGINVVFTIISPLLLSIIWVSIMGFTDWQLYLFYFMGAASTLFRGFKIGFRGFVGDEDE